MRPQRPRKGESMNVLHELNQLDCGGVEKVIRNIVKYDKQNQHTIVAYKDGAFREELEKAGAKIVISKDVEVDFEVDVVHIHSGGGNSEIAKQLEGAFPVIETIHSPIRSPIHANLVTQRVGVTEAVSRMNANCLTILNGIDFDGFLPTRDEDDVRQELGIVKGIPVIGRLGRIGRDKCLEEWLLACYYLQREGYQFTPLIVGGEARGCEGYIGKLKLMAASLPVEGVIWTGHKDAIAEYLQVMDIFLYPSPTEGFGLSFIEAMYAGLTLVTYKNEVTSEIAEGYAVLTERSVPGLVKGVKKALDVNIRDAIGPLAHSWVKDRFDAERMSLQYQELYAKVAKEKVTA